MKPSLRPAKLPRSDAPPASNAPPASGRQADSGPRFFMNGRYYYRQMGDLALNLCAARSLSDDDWHEYLYGSLAVARELGRGPNACIIEFAGGVHPNAGQRRISADFMRKERIRPIDRVAILTDNDLLRGAMTAFAWLVPTLKYRAFEPSALESTCEWLSGIATIDTARVLVTWQEARTALGLGSR